VRDLVIAGRRRPLRCDRISAYSLFKRDLSHSLSTIRLPPVTLSSPDQRVGHDARQTDGAPAPRAARLSRPVRALLGLKEIDVALADLLFIVPAALAGIGGTLLGDRAGLWIKTAFAARKKD
jgi:hypothetical protein